MNNAERYHFSDFTLENYRRLLKLAKKTYIFRTYTNFKRDERFVLWRHDVDFSPEGARRMALIEADEGIVATYFLSLHSNFYNLLEKTTGECVKDILACGHQIGLHFDSRYYELEREEDLERLLSWEKEILEEYFNQGIQSFSFHMTTPFTMTCRKWEYGGLINTYAEYFQTSVGYCSDSNGYWRFRRLENVLDESKDERLHVLTHPAWWQDKIMSPKERLLACIDAQGKDNVTWYEKIVEIDGRKNVDWN